MLQQQCGDGNIVMVMLGRQHGDGSAVNPYVGNLNLLHIFLFCCPLDGIIIFLVFLLRKSFFPTVLLSFLFSNKMELQTNGFIL